MPNLNAVDPRTLPNLFAWYDAKNINGLGADIPADAAAIAQWNDLSGNARHLVQGTGANQPIYKRDIASPGGHVVRFVDATDTMQAAVAGVVVRPVTVIAVFKNSEADDAAVNKIVTFNAQRIGLALDWAVANAFTALDDNAAGATSGVAGDITTFHVASFVAQPASAPAQVRSITAVDGVHTNAAGVAGTNTNSNVDVGNAGFIGDVAEILIFTGELSQPVVFAIETALAQKWGIFSTYRHGV
jgi:hypothetical protein